MCTSKSDNNERLFILNHFCCPTGLESRLQVNPNLLGGGDNGWGVLFPRVLACTEANGQHLAPNYIAVDWADVGEGKQVVDYLNGVIDTIGTGERCIADENCATGSCNRSSKRCQCQLCEGLGCPGCSPSQTCALEDKGEHICAVPSMGFASQDYQSDAMGKISFSVPTTMPCIVLILFLFVRNK